MHTNQVNMFITSKIIIICQGCIADPTYPLAIPVRTNLRIANRIIRLANIGSHEVIFLWDEPEIIACWDILSFFLLEIFDIQMQITLFYKTAFTWLEAVVQRYIIKKVFLKISLNSQETCASESFS